MWSQVVKTGHDLNAHKKGILLVCACCSHPFYVYVTTLVKLTFSGKGPSN